MVLLAIVVLASCVQVPPVVETEYHITFESNGGSAVSSKTVEEGKTVAKPTDPIRAGSTFKGWYLNGTNYTFSERLSVEEGIVKEIKDTPRGFYVTVEFDE